jgi:protein-S-isoprenylcysteine O-methyltransferase Ste14
VVLLGIVAGIWVLPLVYACTNWLGAADYTLPVWAGWLGTGLLAVSLIVRREAHRALGSHWSPTLETADGQSLVTRGIYAHARHPMYASLVLWAAAQPMLLQNLLAGWGGVVAVSLIWLIRVPREEAMMVERFGDAYREYMARTGRFVS